MGENVATLATSSWPKPKHEKDSRLGKYLEIQTHSHECVRLSQHSSEWVSELEICCVPNFLNKNANKNDVQIKHLLKRSWSENIKTRPASSIWRSQLVQMGSKKKRLRIRYH